MSDVRWCDLCGDPKVMDDMVYIHCGSYVCYTCILKEAKKIKRKKKEKTPKKKCYEVQEIKDPNVSSGIHYRVSHIPTDSRIATCYLQENANFVCKALNKISAAPFER